MQENNLFGGPDAEALIRVIDYETTGYPDQDGCEVLEMARVDVQVATGQIVEEWSSLARPSGPIPPETRAIHHIGPEDVADAPRAGDLWRDMWRGLADTDFIAAHNVEFERAIHHGNGRRWICTYKCALSLWPDAPSHSNQALRYWLDIEGHFPGFDPAKAMPPHRALPDAYVTAFLVLRMMEMGYDPARLAEITAAPVLLPRLKFGKHKGMPFSEAPLDYLDWIVEKSDLDRDVKHTARFWIERRRAA